MTSLAHNDDFFETPRWIIDDLQAWTGLEFNLDVCANEQNKKCEFYINEQMDALTQEWWYGVKETKARNGRKMYEFKWFETAKNKKTSVVFNNPPRSINGKFVLKALEQWQSHNIDIVQLLCWNDLGNKYGGNLLYNIFRGKILVKNYGKIKFEKDGIISKYPSRLTYFAAWYRRQ